ncbi:hypothetical protein KDAU_42790 [Dictyobacter aurantiacus]|uniref:Uncharacterized protein n=1 Tax=Dictyobacter aurantiacus TaxID=1936993 RepID=A0A401ZJD3_9CHLR|nr:hypothetical protein KDAU_42790 [Dictyobacter aurantiacus]
MNQHHRAVAAFFLKDVPFSKARTSAPAEAENQPVTYESKWCSKAKRVAALLDETCSLL